MPKNIPAIDRYNSFVNVRLRIVRMRKTGKLMVVPDNNKCWLWTGGQRNGYGAFWYEGKTQLSHRVGWFLQNGEIPDGYLVCHRCDVKLCQNRSHWFLGTFGDNNKDKIDKGRHNLPHGEKHWGAKLSSAQVAEIRSGYNGERGQVRALGREYGVSHATISMILNRKSRYYEP